MRLQVHVSGKHIAYLYRERDEYVLRYLSDASTTDFVSLTMPVREQAWRWPRDLHPFFRQNLPEGYLLGVIREEFGSLMDGTDLSLLAVVGGRGIGRVIITPEGSDPGYLTEALDLNELITADNSTKQFAQLVRRYARSAVSGVIPKFVAPDAEVGDATVTAAKPTLRTNRFIIKGSGENTPYLGFNELFSMRVLERLEVVPVAKTRMSDDGNVLLVEQFDVNDAGEPDRGFEDTCSLLGLPPHEKYATTTERVLNAARAYISSADLRKQLEHFGWQILTNYVIRNADCHSKNLALYYRTLADVRFTPVYDLVTTQAYPQYANNAPGLSVGGRKTWVPGKTLEQFFNSRLGIKPHRYREMRDTLCESAVEVAAQVIDTSRNEPRWRNVAKHMVHAWNDGITALQDPARATHFVGLDAAIKSAGFSDPETVANQRTVIGRSELLGRR